MSKHITIELERASPRKTLAASWWTRWSARLLIGFITGSLFAFLALPLVSLLLHAPLDVLLSSMFQPGVLEALQLSIFTTLASLLFTVVFGLPVAYLLARFRFPGHKVLETLVMLPTVLPPVVAGIALLLTFGRLGLVGHYLTPWGITLPFTTTAVIMAQTFISAPFFITSAKAGIEQLDIRYELASATLGASRFYTFRRVVLPLIRPALFSGIGLAWTRALGEFGATITFAGSFPGVTQTLPIAVYITSENDLDAAVAVSVVLLAISFGVLLVVQIERAHHPK
ncbi:molybdenum ABC transporter permease [Reticulibacter mediterranei]|uniref:Molybdenum transport system permease n=1 Tax=Reticulibacter mediterranei TaxID=2778369 RepID=A0A8J3IQY9_9CHLR|nr:ABC transporter permease [Reticulibacter mediterranei]GHO94651.1 molybdenum ABC transporter permease [Reticulibacter mediterranei]